jgi:hypothetical protein
MDDVLIILKEGETHASARRNNIKAATVIRFINILMMHVDGFNTLLLNSPFPFHRHQQHGNTTLF